MQKQIRAGPADMPLGSDTRLSQTSFPRKNAELKEKFGTKLFR